MCRIAKISDARGTVASISNAIYEAVGNIVGLGINEILDSYEVQWEMTIRVQDIPAVRLAEVLPPLVHTFLDMRAVQRK